MVLTLEPSLKPGGNSLGYVIDIIATPKYNGNVVTHYGKLFEFPMVFEGDASNILEKEWDKHYVPMLDVATLNKSKPC